MAKLYILSGPDLGKSVEIAHGALMGRSPTCAVHLRHTSVSREHARMDLLEGRWTIVDLSSRNGVTLRGERVTTAVLEDGDEFVVGELLLRFRQAASSDVGTAIAPSAGGTPQQRLAREEPHVEEVALEGDWDSETHHAAAEERRHPIVPPRLSDLKASLAATALTPRAILPPSIERAPSRTQGGSVAVVDDRRVLQYQRVAERKGFFASDFSQQPLWVRLAITVLALVAFVAIFWLAYKGTMYLKSRAQGHATDVELDH